MVHNCPECKQSCFCDCDDSNDASGGVCFHCDDNETEAWEEA